MKKHGEAILSLAIFAAAELLGFTPDAIAFTKPVSECRGASVKAVAAYSIRLTKTLAKCHAARLAGSIPSSSDCNVPEQAAAAFGSDLPDIFAGGLGSTRRRLR